MSDHHCGNPQCSGSQTAAPPEPSAGMRAAGLVTLDSKSMNIMQLEGKSRRRQFLVFLLCGGFAAFVNFMSRILINHYIPYFESIIVAYILGMITAFILNRWLVFTEAGNQLHNQIFWFTMVNIAAVLQTLAVSLLLARIALPAIGFTWHDETVAHAFGVAIPVVTSYFGHKYLSFGTS